MLLNVRKFLMGFVLTLMLLPMMAIASTEFKGTETVNINKANAATLAAYLKGIGANKAEAIVKYRKSNGSFKSAADIKNVPGVGDETYKDIKSKISTSRGKSTAPKGYKLGETSGKSSTNKKKSSKKSTTAKKTSSSKTDSAEAILLRARAHQQNQRSQKLQNQSLLIKLLQQLKSLLARKPNLRRSQALQKRLLAKRKQLKRSQLRKRKLQKRKAKFV